MLKILFFSTNFLIISVFLFFSSCYAFDDGDFQYWNNESISWEIYEHWNLKLEEEFRFGDDASNFYCQHADLGVVYSGITDWLDIGLNYRHIFEDKAGEWKQENRPHLNLAFKFNLDEFNFSNRVRFAYRNREDADNFWQLRNKLTVKFPLKLTRFDIQPYLADEIFIDFDSKELNRNRLYSGFSLKLWKSLKGEIFYLWQISKKSGRWIDYNILGTKLIFSF